MMSHLSFLGRVVLVTGAGGGLGREYALLFGARGASVVVNDLGGSMTGDGKDARPADKVVEEIRAKGGKAVADYNSVEDGDKVVETAIKNFGRIDVVVNNAGILRDKSFGRISDLDWDLIHRIHLRGSFLVTRAAWPYMRKQKYGRIIMTSSAAGLYGNFGQANYSAAKMGVVGLSHTLGIEGAKYGIKANSIIPTAGSRLTQTVMPPDIVEALKPEYVAPLVVYLCHESCEETCGIFEAAAGWLGKIRWQKSKGKIVREEGKQMTPESVRDNWDDITDMTNATYPTSTREGTGFLLQVLQDVTSKKSVTPIGNSAMSTFTDGKMGLKMVHTNAGSVDPEKAKNASIPPVKFKYTDQNVILYNLGIGSSLAQEDGLKFLYEGHESFSVWPSFSVIPAFAAAVGLFSSNEDNGFNIDLSQLLHGEQYTEVFKPLPTECELITKIKVAEILDKKSGAVAVIDMESRDESGQMIAFNQFVAFLVGAGGFGGKKTYVGQVPCVQPPSRKPDASTQEKIPRDQAALYRLSGDRNPLHIDPNFAAMAGFSTPILHGLCSYGYALRHVLQRYANSNVTKFKCMKARFAKPVIPGQTLLTEMWKEGLRIHFQCKVVETGDSVLTGAYVDLHSVDTVKAENNCGDLQSDELLKDLSRTLSGRQDVAKKVNAIFQWDITKNKNVVAQWTMDLKNGNGSIYAGPSTTGIPGCTLTVDDSDVTDLILGKLDPQRAFIQGKLKLKGDFFLPQKLQTILNAEKAKL